MGWSATQTLLRQLANVGLSALMLLAVGIALLPIPSALLDILLSGNLALSLLILLVAIHGRAGLSFSALPSALLLSTLLRLALNLSSTRLILLQADAGRVIAAFGSFMLQGDPTVGAVLFCTLLIIQFIVVAKGAERVAEVGARFTLDAIPGRQLAIDTDVRAFALGRGAARSARDSLQQESQFYGAMDGAMKFVRGDAIAALLICVIDLAAGFSLGVARDGLSLTESLQTYGLLTLGDGLCAQIPALLVSTAAAIVVTRVQRTHSEQTLGSALWSQLLGDAQVVRLCAGFLLVLSLLPGLPAWPLLGLALLLWVASRRPVDATAAAATAPSHGAPHEGLDNSNLISPVTEPLVLALQPRLLAQLQGPLRTELASLPQQTFAQYGLPVPLPRLCSDPQLPVGGFAIRLQEVPAKRGQLANGLPVAQACQQLLDTLHETLAQRGHELLNLHQTDRLLTALEQLEPARVQALVPARLSLPRILGVLQRLARDGVSIRPLGEILEHAAQLYPSSEGSPVDEDARYAALRLRLGRRISHQFARNGRLTALTLDIGQEEALVGHLELAGTTGPTGLPETLAQELQTRLRAALPTLLSGEPEGGRVVRPTQPVRPVLLTSTDLRPYLADWLRSRLPELVVLSYGEIPDDMEVDTRVAPPQ